MEVSGGGRGGGNGGDSEEMVVETGTVGVVMAEMVTVGAGVEAVLADGGGCGRGGDGGSDDGGGGKSSSFYCNSHPPLHHNSHTNHSSILPEWLFMSILSTGMFYPLALLKSNSVR